MLTCNKAGSRMVVDAANSNGPFQPVALLHIRGTVPTCSVAQPQSSC
ncbi:PPP2R5C isoform 20 [Pan troglodytes]|uniref:PPP2R5C isoform 21 n=2 Tax=Hominidae TaxID=9604 RepID=A0A2J8SZZ1_PONAB|nr:PPP2R5C isoform 20 [Pan troglodytes]PNJ26296.1 PPP2R5C isoform 21 [Pongo abelii]